MNEQGQGKGRDDVYQWTKDSFHPRLKPSKLPDISDGVDGKVICFVLGVVAVLGVVLVSKYLGQIILFLKELV